VGSTPEHRHCSRAIIAESTETELRTDTGEVDRLGAELLENLEAHG